MQNKNIILCGVGGQGTILASKLMAAAAMRKGIEVKTAETIGMAQRGGSVFSHVRLGEGLQSPMIAPGKADIIIAFEPAEAVRHLSFLKATLLSICENRLSTIIARDNDKAILTFCIKDVEGFFIYRTSSTGKALDLAKLFTGHELTCPLECLLTRYLFRVHSDSQHEG